MGEARRRGTYEERKQQAIAEGRGKEDTPRPRRPRLPDVIDQNIAIVGGLQHIAASMAIQECLHMMETAGRYNAPLMVLNQGRRH